MVCFIGMFDRKEVKADIISHIYVRPASLRVTFPFKHLNSLSTQLELKITNRLYWSVPTTYLPIETMRFPDRGSTITLS